MDVKLTFLNGVVEEVYLNQPLCYIIERQEDTLMKLLYMHQYCLCSCIISFILVLCQVF